MDRDLRLIAFCQQAVRIPSPSGQEREVAQLMKQQDGRVWFRRGAHRQARQRTGPDAGRRPGKTILLDGHIDNVDVIDADEWTTTPLAAKSTRGGFTAGAHRI